jgi:hypothetical protein
MAAKLESIITGSGFVNTVPTLMQTQGLQQLARKAGNRIRVEPAHDPKMLIKNRFEVSSDDSFQDCTGIPLSTTRKRNLEKRAVQI